MTEGALVGVADAEPMAVVQQIDQVYVDVRQPAAQLESLQRSAGGGELPVTIIGAAGGRCPNVARCCSPASMSMRAPVM